MAPPNLSHANKRDMDGLQGDEQEIETPMKRDRFEKVFSN